MWAGVCVGRHAISVWADLNAEFEEEKTLMNEYPEKLNTQ